MRKSCIALVLLLLGAATSFGASDSFDISAFAYSDSGSPSNEDHDNGAGIVTASQSGNYAWAYSLSVSAYASVRGHGYAASSAFAEASVSGAVSNSINAFDNTPDISTGDEDSASDSGTMFMAADTTIELDGEVDAVTDWFSGTAQCRAMADASGSVSITLQ